MARFLRDTETVNGRSISVIGDPVKFADVGIPFTPDAPGTGTPYTDAVDGHSRRRFPGGPASNVRAHNRSGVRSTDLAGTNAEPGRPFYIERVLSAPGETPRRVQTWTFGYVGRWRDLKSKILTDLAPAVGYRLRNASGTSISLEDAPAPIP